MAIVAPAKAKRFAWLIASGTEIPKHYPRAVW